MTRHDVAQFIADTTPHERPKVIEQAAAWLLAKNRRREAAYLANDVAAILAEEGYLLVHVTTAHELSSETRTELVSYVRRLTDAKEVELREHIDQDLIGGAVIATPTARLDASVKYKLAKFIEGATA